jgi:hypothetical protein
MGFDNDVLSDTLHARRVKLTAITFPFRISSFVGRQQNRPKIECMIDHKGCWLVKYDVTLG